jgi:hypothetical protein
MLANKNALIRCSQDLERLIGEHYDTSRWVLNTHGVLDAILDKYSFEAVSLVLANTIVAKSSDERICADNKEWAKYVLSAETGCVTADREYLVDSVNPGLVDLLATAYRKKYI